MAELLPDDGADAQAAVPGRNPHRSGTSLLDISSMRSGLSKIEAGKLHLERIEFGLRQTFEDAVDLLAESANLQHLELTCFVPDGFRMPWSATR